MIPALIIGSVESRIACRGVQESWVTTETALRCYDLTARLIKIAKVRGPVKVQF